MFRSSCLFLFVFLLQVQIVSHSQSVNIIPQPASVKIEDGKFIINNNTRIVYAIPSLEKNAIFLKTYIQQLNGLKLQVIKGRVAVGSNAILLELSAKDLSNKEAYKLVVDAKQIVLTAGGEPGIFYGIQTFVQLMPNEKANVNNVQQVVIEDEPRFAYRGMHLDVGRHFFSVDFIKKYIDHIAMYKMNYFHWHLTDDEGWRIKIKKYPLLTSVGAFRNGTITGHNPGTGNTNTKYGGYYTQAQIKEVVKYASDRYITIIPEIEMPGHASAAIAAYPELSCFPNEPTKKPTECCWSGDSTGKQVQQSWGVFEDVFTPTENTFKFLENVLDEVIPLFPSKYIHIGGDESPKQNWKRSPFCQQFIKEKGLKDEHGLQSYFIQRIEKYLNGKGRQIIGWDEILEGGLAPNATVMSWRGEEGGIQAAKLKHDVIMTPGGWCYFDHSQTTPEDSLTFGGYLPTKKVYEYDPIPKMLEADERKHILGAQGNVWTEYMENPQKVEYMVNPRMGALAEVLWTPKANKNWDDFARRMEYQFKSFDEAGIGYSKGFYDPITLPSLNQSGLLSLQFSTQLADLDVYYKLGDDKLIKYNKGENIEVPQTTESLMVTTYRNNVQLGRSITLKTTDLKKKIFKK